MRQRGEEGLLQLLQLLDGPALPQSDRFDAGVLNRVGIHALHLVHLRHHLLLQRRESLGEGQRSERHSVDVHHVGEEETRHRRRGFATRGNEEEKSQLIHHKPFTQRVVVRLAVRSDECVGHGGYDVILAVLAANLAMNRPAGRNKNALAIHNIQKHVLSLGKP